MLKFFSFLHNDFWLKKEFKKKERMDETKDETSYKMPWKG
jgi:hypothetical protein